MAGMIILMIVVAMGCGWLFRTLLLRTLRVRHPDEFAALGYPSNRQMTSLLPKHQDLHLKFWHYLWGGKVFRVDDKRVTRLGWLALSSDIVLAGSVLALFWSAWK